jgi:hypothetical protein
MSISIGFPVHLLTIYAVQDRKGLPIHDYGRGEAKTIEQLWQELHSGESALEEAQDGKPLRSVSIVSVIIRNQKGEVHF